MRLWIMAVKTITIDMEAYEALSAAKRANESFSRVIKRRFRPECTASALRAALPSCLVSKETLDRIEDVVRSRRDSPAASPIVDAGE
jgi:hypothetical protein